ncbi:helix-turn-helix domain-containing protein [Actinomadura hibisca]|uniref:helix-turn-helix domain-containing protein n=1 Tax=Actinomadura hibisca TaxID=68565 RepID=UPI00082A976A|nr:helix-turn-helix transcriptional regulator [Actinomadura hibisca]
MAAKQYSPDALIRERERAGLTRMQVAIKIDSTPNTVFNYERPRTARAAATPSAKRLGQLADALGCSIDAFFAVPAEGGGDA